MKKDINRLFEENRDVFEDAHLAFIKNAGVNFGTHEGDIDTFI